MRRPSPNIFRNDSSGSNKAERYCEVEQLLDCVIPFERPFTEKDVVDSEADAENAARRLREDKWNLGGDPLPNVHELLELKGIKVHEAETMDEAFDVVLNIPETLWTRQ